MEVADTTLPYDRRRKVPFYARIGIPEVWLLDLNGERVTVFREPGAGATGPCSMRRAGPA